MFNNINTTHFLGLFMHAVLSYAFLVKKKRVNIIKTTRKIALIIARFIRLSCCVKLVDCTFTMKVIYKKYQNNTLLIIRSVNSNIRIHNYFM